MKNSSQSGNPFIPSWMFEAGLDCQEGWVLVFLWRCRNAESHQCNPSIATIVRKTGVSRRKVFLCLKSLSDKGLISIVSGYSKKSNSYNLMVHGVHGVVHHMHPKVLKEVNTYTNNLGVHHMHHLPSNENLGVLRSGEMHVRFLKELMPTLSPNAYRDYRVEVLGDGFASIVNTYGGRTKIAIGEK